MGTELRRMQRLVEAWEEMDMSESPEGFRDIPWVAEDVEFDVGPLGLPDEQEWHGREGLIRGWARWMQQWDNYRAHGSNLEQVGSHVILNLRAEAVGAASRVPLTILNVQVWSFRDGLLAGIHLFEDRDSALDWISREAPADVGAPRTPPAP